MYDELKERFEVGKPLSDRELLTLILLELRGKKSKKKPKKK